MKAFVLITLIALSGCITSGGTVPVSKAKMSEGYYMKGLSYLQSNDFERASAEFNRALQTDSTNKRAYYGLGIISDYQGKLTDAQSYFEKAIDEDTDFAEAYNALGVVFSKQRKWKEAIKAFNKALSNKLYTTPHIAFRNIGNVYMEQKDYAKAVEAYRDSKRFVVLDTTIYMLGSALVEAGKIKEAISEFREGVGISPQNGSLRYALALALLKDGNKKAAVTEFKTVVQLDPKSELAHKANDYIKTLR